MAHAVGCVMYVWGREGVLCVGCVCEDGILGVVCVGGVGASVHAPCHQDYLPGVDIPQALDFPAGFDYSTVLFYVPGEGPKALNKSPSAATPPTGPGKVPLAFGTRYPQTPQTPDSESSTGTRGTATPAPAPAEAVTIALQLNPKKEVAAPHSQSEERAPRYWRPPSP